MNENSSPEILIPKKNLILDATTLTSIMNCARFTDLRHNLSLVQMGGKSNALECGSIVHKVLEVYYQSIIQGLNKSQAISNGITAGELYITGCKFCSDFVPHTCTHCSAESTDCTYCNGTKLIDKPECNHPVNEFPGVKNTPPDSDTKTYKTGWKFVLQTCEEYFEFYKNDHWVPLETEVVKRKILYEDDEIRIMWKAKLDLIADTNQGIYPIDHKTMKQRRDTLSLNNQFIGQCILMNTRNMFINKIGFQTSLEPKEKFQRVNMPYSADRLVEWQSEILPYWGYQLISYSETGYWPPNYSNCEGKFGNCVYNEVCKSDRGMREEELKLHFVVGPKWDVENLEKE